MQRRLVKIVASGFRALCACAALLLDTFAREHWMPELTGAIGVWLNAALVARVLVAWNSETGDPVPYLREIDPPRQQSLACGD